MLNGPHLKEQLVRKSEGAEAHLPTPGGHTEEVSPPHPLACPRFHCQHINLQAAWVLSCKAEEDGNGTVLHELEMLNELSHFCDSSKSVRGDLNLCN